MVWHLLICGDLMCDDELGLRVGEGLDITPPRRPVHVAANRQTLTDAELDRIDKLGANGPRDVAVQQMTHCVLPDARVVLAPGGRKRPP